MAKAMRGTKEDCRLAEHDKDGNLICSDCHQPTPYLTPGFEVWVCSLCAEKRRGQKHIGELPDKSAAAILASTLQDDSYHRSIMAAAGELVAHGLGHYRYITQWASGSTVWEGWWSVVLDGSIHLPGRWVVDCYGRIS